MMTKGNGIPQFVSRERIHCREEHAGYYCGLEETHPVHRTHDYIDPKLMHVKRDGQRRTGDGWITFIPAKSPALQDDLVQMGIFWHEENARFYADAYNAALAL